MDSNLHVYQVYTLIDITQTKVTTFSKEKEKARNQQRNWETVMQIIGLRAQLLDVKYIGVTKDNVKNYSFGVNYQGVHNIWKFEFTVEHADLYTIDNDRYGALKNDFRIAPVILGLDETAKPSIGMFYPSGTEKNIYFISKVSN